MDRAIAYFSGLGRSTSRPAQEEEQENESEEELEEEHDEQEEQLGDLEQLEEALEQVTTGTGSPEEREASSDVESEEEQEEQEAPALVGQTTEITVPGAGGRAISVSTSPQSLTAIPSFLRQAGGAQLANTSTGQLARGPISTGLPAGLAQASTGLPAGLTRPGATVGPVPAGLAQASVAVPTTNPLFAGAAMASQYPASAATTSQLLFMPPIASQPVYAQAPPVKAPLPSFQCTAAVTQDPIPAGILRMQQALAIALGSIEANAIIRNYYAKLISYKLVYGVDYSPEQEAGVNIYLQALARPPQS